MKQINRFGLFLSGMFLAFDFTGLLGMKLLSVSAPMERKSDRENIASDWQNVGEDLYKAMSNVPQK
jgi:hypothetical protein